MIYLCMKFFLGSLYLKDIFQSMSSILSRPREAWCGTTEQSYDVLFMTEGHSGHHVVRKKNCFIPVEGYLPSGTALTQRLHKECSVLFQDTSQVSQVKSFWDKIKWNEWECSSPDYNNLFFLLLYENKFPKEGSAVTFHCMSQAKWLYNSRRTQLPWKGKNTRRCLEHLHLSWQELKI